MEGCLNVTMQIVTLAVLCMQHNIRCNPMQPLYGAIPAPDVPLRVTRGALVAHRCTYAPARCRTSQDHMTFVSLSVCICGTILLTLYSMVGTGRFQEQGQCLLLA